MSSDGVTVPQYRLTTSTTSEADTKFRLRRHLTGPEQGEWPLRVCWFATWRRQCIPVPTGLGASVDGMSPPPRSRPHLILDAILRHPGVAMAVTVILWLLDHLLAG